MSAKSGNGDPLRPTDESDDPFRSARLRMVSEQIRGRDIRDRRVLAAMESVPRHLFVSSGDTHVAYEDGPLSIGFDQTISQPYIVALMTETARLRSEDRVLEVGTGSGYQTAVLAEIAQVVYTVERLEPLATTAERRLEDLGYTNVHVRVGGACDAWVEKAPFDAIIVTAAPEEVPKPLLAQLAPSGRMVIPVGLRAQQLFLIERREDGFKQTKIADVRFVPLVENGD